MGRRPQELKLPPEELAAGFLKDRATVDALLEPPRARRMARLNRLAQNLVLAGSICVACYFGSIIVWHYGAPPPDDFGPVAMSTGMPTAQEPEEVINVQAIIDAHLFGKPAENVGPPPETKLALALKGIIFTDVSEDARAIIAAEGQAQAAFRLGQTVTSGVTLADIRREYVILDRAGNKETLRLEANKSKGAKAAASSVATDKKFDRRGDYQVAKVLGRVQGRLRTDPGSVMSLMRLMPVESGGDIVGVRVFPGAEPGIFQIFQLEPGDILISVNDIPLDSTSRGLEVMRDLTAATELRLVVKRADQLLSFAYSIAP
tara:strand:- start:4766 stop:5719 length:954 start_codon:yes stop_codon:yes gene_type:complete